MCINKWLDIENVEYTYNETSFSLIKQETLLYVTAWVNLDVTLCETSVTKRQLMILVLWGSRVFKLLETESRTVLVREWKEEEKSKCSVGSAEFQFCKIK